MTWDLDLDGPQHPYEALAARLRAGIRAGEWLPDRGLPSELDLVEFSGLARSTVRRALNALRTEGWIYSVQARGWFVAARDQWPED